MLKNDNIPLWLMSTTFRQRFLQVRQIFLIVFQIAGISILILVGLLLFGDDLGVSAGEADESTSLLGKISTIAFLLIWNLIVFFVLRSGFSELRHLKLKKEAVQVVRGRNR